MAMNMPSAAHVPNTPAGPSAVEPRRNPALAASWVNVAAGVWLVVSAFVLPHADATRFHTWVIGALIGFVAAGSLFVPKLRYGTAVLAAYLFVSTLMLTYVVSITRWHDGAVAVLVVLTAMLARDRPTRPGMR